MVVADGGDGGVQGEFDVELVGDGDGDVVVIVVAVAAVAVLAEEAVVDDDDV